jgi:hypothetical protein
VREGLKKRKRSKDKRKREDWKKKKKMGAMVSDQTANQAAKSLKEGEEKKWERWMVGDQTPNQAAKPLKKGGEKRTKRNNHQFWNSRIAGSLSCSVTPLASSSVCVSLRQVWSPLVVA